MESFQVIPDLSLRLHEIKRESFVNTGKFYAVTPAYCLGICLHG